MYSVVWDNVIMDTIREKSIDFWDNFVIKDIPPPDVMPSMPLLKRLKREPDKVAEIPTELVQHWLNAKEMLKKAEEVKVSVEEEMLAAMGDAEGGACDLGLLTYLKQTRVGIDLKRLREEKPEVAEDYKKPTTFRVLRLKKPKKSKF